MTRIFKQIGRLCLALGLTLPGFACAETELPDNAIWLDVRSVEEYQAGRVEGAYRITHTEIADHINEVTSDKDAPIVLYCRSGHRAGIAQEALRQLGYTNTINIGGFNDAQRLLEQHVEQQKTEQ